MSEELTDKNMDPIIPAVVKAVPEGFWKMLYADLGQPTVQSIGKSLGKAADFCSIPFYAMGYWSDKFKLNLAHRLKEYGKKLEKIPEAKQYEVDPQIGAPILDQLSYTTNDEIAGLFTTLLANASNLETLDKAHPSFVYLIGRLSVDEARIVKFLKGEDEIPHCSFYAIVAEHKEYAFITVVDHVTMIPFKVELSFPNNLSAYLSNLISLGILKDNDRTWKDNEIVYNEICEKYNLSLFQEQYQQPDFKKVEVVKGYYEVTAFGRLFIDACIRD